MEDGRMRLDRAAEAAARLVAAGHTDSVCYAAAVEAQPAGYTVVGAPLTMAEPGSGPGEPTVDWLCAGKAVVAYAAVRAVLDSGHGVDEDLRPLLPATAQCPPITLRQ